MSARRARKQRIPHPHGAGGGDALAACGAPQTVNVYADRYLIYSDITREKTYRYDTESKSELELLNGYYDYLYIADGQLHAIGAEEQTVALA